MVQDNKDYKTPRFEAGQTDSPADVEVGERQYQDELFRHGEILRNAVQRLSPRQRGSALLAIINRPSSYFGVNS